MVLSSNGGLLGDEPETRLKGSEGDGPASPRAVRKPAHEFVADLHIHSRYAYACSKNLTLDNIAATAKTKGIHLLATGDFTHPMWLDELQANLIPVDEGTFESGGSADCVSFWVRRSAAFTSRAGRGGGFTCCFTSLRSRRSAG